MNINERQRGRRRADTPERAMTDLFKDKGRSNRERSRLLKLAKGKNVKRGSNPQTNEPDREDSQTMLDIKDKIAETLLNSFNELLNEGGKSSPERTEAREKRQAAKELSRPFKGPTAPHDVPADSGKPKVTQGHHIINTAKNRRRVNQKRKAGAILFGKSTYKNPKNP